MRPAEAPARAGGSLLLAPALALWAVLLLLFLVLAVCAAFYDRFPSDEYIAHRVPEIDVPAFGGYLDFVNMLGVAWLYVPLTVALAALLAARNAWLAAALTAATFLPRYAGTWVKDAVERPRPSSDLLDVTASMSSGHSFPSGHTVGTAALFGLLLFVMAALVPWRPLRWLLQGACLLFVASAGVARVYVGAHWPSDVLGGYLLALLFLILALALLRLMRSTGKPY